MGIQPPNLVAIVGSFAAALVVIIQRNRKRGQQQRTKKKGQASASISKGCRVVPRFTTFGDQQDSDALSIISWNILSDSLASPKRLPWVIPGVLEWQTRAPLIASELRATAADIVALQEVEVNRWSEIRTWLPGWLGILQDPSGSRSSSSASLASSTAATADLDSNKKGQMLLALLWKPRFTLVWHEFRSRAILAQLAWTDSTGAEQHIWVVNVHLEGSPYRPNDRVNQIRNALQRLQARQESLDLNPATCHVVICGDMNSGKTETVYKLLHRGRLEGGSTESYLPSVEVTKTTVSHPYPLQDCYAAGQPLPFTRKAPRVAATIDHIWASKSLSIAGLYDPLKGTKQAPPVRLATPAKGKKHSHGVTMDDDSESVASLGGLTAAFGNSNGSASGQEQSCECRSRSQSPAPSSFSSGGKTSSSKAALNRSQSTQHAQQLGKLHAWPGCTGRALAQSTSTMHSGLPNAFCPSDHLPIGVVLRLKHTAGHTLVDNQQRQDTDVVTATN